MNSSRTHSEEPSFLEAERQAAVWAESLSLDEKIGQVFMARGLDLFPEETRALIGEGRIGNLQAKSHEDVRAELAALQETARIPLWVGADMETGFIGPGFGGTPLPCQMALGAIGCGQAARDGALAAAREARAYGVNMVFGPVMDLAMEPRSPMVNIRAFGSRPEDVVRLGAAVVEGYQEGGLQTAAKHYPGVGRSPVDNHMEEAVLDCDRASFDGVELDIYRALLRAVRLGGVMSGHVRVPAVDPGNLSTTSPALARALRDAGFDGVLMTDSLAMKGVKARVPPERLLPEAFFAGHDLLLGDYAIEPGRQLAWLREAVVSRPDGQHRLDEAVTRVLRAKARQHAIPTDPPDTAAHRALSRALSRRALTLEGDPQALEDGGRDTLFILAGAGREDETRKEIGLGGGRGLEAMLRATFPGQRLMCMEETPGPARIEEILDAALSFGRVVYLAHALPRSYKGCADLPAPQEALLSALRERLAVLVLLGNPFAARRLPPLRAILYAYWGGDAEEAAVDALTGKVRPQGRLPVTWKNPEQSC